MSNSAAAPLPMLRPAARVQTPRALQAVTRPPVTLTRPPVAATAPVMFAHVIADVRPRLAAELLVISAIGLLSAPVVWILAKRLLLGAGAF